MKNWARVTDPRASVDWLDGLEDSLTGYWAPPGYADSTWILHAMYQNEALAGLGTHDDVEKDLVGRGLAQPDVINGIDLTASTIASGTPLGFVERPAPEWSRLRWRERFGPSTDEQLAERSYPPNDRALRAGASWSASIAAPPEGSLDEASLMALVDVLATMTEGGQAAPVTAFYGEVPANDYDLPTVFTGPLGALRELTDTLDASPSNLWPADRSWFVLTDWDITSTGIWGTRQTIDAVRRHPDLETIDWTRGATS